MRTADGVAGGACFFARDGRRSPQAAHATIAASAGDVCG